MHTVLASGDYQGDGGGDEIATQPAFMHIKSTTGCGEETLELFFYYGLGYRAKRENRDEWRVSVA
jgi:hypothetical protein